MAPVPFHSTSSSSTSYTTTTTSSSGTTTSSSNSQQTYSNPSGTTVHTTSQENDGPTFSSTTHYASDGSRLVGGSGSEAGRIEELSREEADKLYEERMEEEYAKREGGA